VINGWLGLGLGNGEGYDLFPIPFAPLEWFAFGSDVKGFGVLSIDSPSQLTWKYIASDTGALVDSFVLIKSHSVSRQY